MFLHYNISKTFASIVTLKKKKKEKKTGSEEYLKKKSRENDPMRISMKKKNDYEKWTRFALFISDLNLVRNVEALFNPKTESQ